MVTNWNALSDEIIECNSLAFMMNDDDDDDDDDVMMIMSTLDSRRPRRQLVDFLLAISSSSSNLERRLCGLSVSLTSFMVVFLSLMFTAFVCDIANAINTALWRQLLIIKLLKLKRYHCE